MTCRNRRLINLFVIFNRERLAIVLFIKLITLLVNFLKASSRVICLPFASFPQYASAAFCAATICLSSAFHFLFQRRNRVLLGIQRRFKLTKAIIEIFAIHDQIFIIRFDIVDHPPTIAGCRLKRVKVHRPARRGAFLYWLTSPRILPVYLSSRSVRAVRNLPTDDPGIEIVTGRDIAFR